MGLSLPRKGPRIPLLSPQQEAEILSLLIAGKGTGPISRELGLPQSRVRGYAQSLGIGRRRQWDSLPPEVRQKIIEDILEHHNFGVDLAAKYGGQGIGYKALLKQAKLILNVPTFRRSRAKDGPLTSDLPQNPPPAKGKLST